MKHQQPLQSLDGSGWMNRERVLKLPVLEIFGPTFQGEGRAIGQKTMFVRTAGCDTTVIGVILPSLGTGQRSQFV